MRIPLMVVMAVLLVPAASAQQVRLWLEPTEDAASAAPNERVYLEYRWNVQFVGTTCPEGTEFGVDFFPDGPPAIYGGASFVPQSALARYPNVTSGSTTLEIFLSDTAPPGQSTTFSLGTGLGMQNAGVCTPPPTRDEESALLTLTVLQPPTTADGTAGGGAGTPSPGVVAWLGALGVAFAVRRGR